METTEVEKFNLKNFLSTKLAAIAAASVAVVGVGVIGVSSSVASGDNIVRGVRAEGQPIGGMDKRSAEKVFTNIAAQKVHPLKFRYQGEEFIITPEDISLTPLVDKATQEAFSYGRGNSTFDNFNEQVKCVLNGRDVQLAAQYD